MTKATTRNPKHTDSASQGGDAAIGVQDTHPLAIRVLDFRCAPDASYEHRLVECQEQARSSNVDDPDREGWIRCAIEYLLDLDIHAKASRGVYELAAQHQHDAAQALFGAYPLTSDEVRRIAEEASIQDDYRGRCTICGGFVSAWQRAFSLCHVGDELCSDCTAQEVV